MNPKDVVRAGYDTVSFAYRSEEDDSDFSEYCRWIEELAELLPAGASVLDLGCGCGIPAAKQLAERFDVTGVDFSPVQIERARRLVPNATLLCEDMTELDFPSSRFDAVVSFYAIIHVPLEEQQPLLKNIYRWLKPGGYIMATVGHSAWTGMETDWLGVQGGDMYWSHADSATYLQWLRQAGFQILWARFIPEGDGGHALILAQAVKTGE